MKFLLSLCILVVLGTTAFGYPTAIQNDTDYSEENEIEDEEEEEEMTIDLSHFGDRIYGEPSEENGQRLMQWDENSQNNPEEMGSYLEGDILVPSSLGRSGLVDKSTRWPGGKIPYVIEGNFSK